MGASGSSRVLSQIIWANAGTGDELAKGGRNRERTAISDSLVAVRVAGVAIVVAAQATGVVLTARRASGSIIVTVDVTLRDRIGVRVVIIVGIDKTAG
jgi:hypothetical protein